MGVRVFHRDRPDERLPLIASDARLVVWPGTGAETANMNYVRMQPGEENVPHAHPTSEDTIFVLAGHGTIADLTNDVVLEFKAGQVIHVPPGVEHQVRGDCGEEIVSVGGPCPADRAMLRAAGLLDRG
jgi:quercetin dioxygenase-like cupin family protein